MSASINKVQLIGHIGKTPEIRTTQDGTKIANFTMATSEYWKDKNTGERIQKPEWHKIVVFNERLVRVVEDYLKKGSKIYIDGQLQTRKWTDKDGHERYVTEIVLQKFKGEILLMDSKETTHPDSAQGSIHEGTYAECKGNSGDKVYEELNDEIPF